MQRNETARGFSNQPNGSTPLFQKVYDAAMTGAIRELDTMSRKDVERLSTANGIVGAAASSLLDYYRENDEKLRIAAEARREFQEAHHAS